MIRNMNELLGKKTLREVLEKASQTQTRVRFYGANMIILAEGVVAYVGDNIVAVKHQSDKEPDEFIVQSAIIKIQFIGEYTHY